MHLAAFIDIGFKNLATLIVDLDQLKLFLNDREQTDSGIFEWRVDDVTETRHKACTSLTKKGEVCGKKAVWVRRAASSKDLPEFACGTHCKDQALYKKAPKPKRGNLVSLIDSMYKLYDSINNLKYVTSVDIEKQVSRNPIMRELGTASYCWFVLRRVTSLKKNDTKLDRLTMFSNKRKLKVWKGRELVPPTYSQKGQVRKWLAKSYTDLLLQRDSTWHDFLCSSSKKDDLSDCFLMAVWRVVGPGGVKPLKASYSKYSTGKESGKKVETDEDW